MRLEGVCVTAVPGLCRARSGRCTMYRSLCACVLMDKEPAGHCSLSGWMPACKRSHFRNVSVVGASVGRFAGLFISILLG